MQAQQSTVKGPVRLAEVQISEAETFNSQTHFQ